MKKCKNCDKLFDMGLWSGMILIGAAILLLGMIVMLLDNQTTIDYDVLDNICEKEYGWEFEYNRWSNKANTIECKNWTKELKEEVPEPITKREE